MSISPIAKAACLAVLLALMVYTCGCTTSGSRAPRPAVVNHVVFIKLVDPGDTDAIIADADSLLPSIPGVVSYYAGKHIETGRENIVQDYDIGVYIGFDSVRDYEAYVSHPDHVRLVELWLPRIDWLRIYDVADPTP
jgi:hypothetical protein